MALFGVIFSEFWTLGQRARPSASRCSCSWCLIFSRMWFSDQIESRLSLQFATTKQLLELLRFAAHQLLFCDALLHSCTAVPTPRSRSHCAVSV